MPKLASRLREVSDIGGEAIGSACSMRAVLAAAMRSVPEREFARSHVYMCAAHAGRSWPLVIRVRGNCKFAQRTAAWSSCNSKAQGEPHDSLPGQRLSSCSRSNAKCSSVLRACTGVLWHRKPHHAVLNAAHTVASCQHRWTGRGVRLERYVFNLLGWCTHLAGIWELQSVDHRRLHSATSRVCTSTCTCTSFPAY